MYNRCYINLGECRRDQIRSAWFRACKGKMVLCDFSFVIYGSSAASLCQRFNSVFNGIITNIIADYYLNIYFLFSGIV